MLFVNSSLPLCGCGGVGFEVSLCTPPPGPDGPPLATGYSLVRHCQCGRRHPEEVSERYPSAEALWLAIERNEVRWKGRRAPNHWRYYRTRMIASS